MTRPHGVENEYNLGLQFLYRKFCSSEEPSADTQASCMPTTGLGTRGKSRRSLVGCATCRKTPISWSAIDKIPMPGHLFEGNPVDEGITFQVPMQYGFI